MSLTEKVAYIRGVVSGMDFDTTTKEGKVIELLIDLLDDIAEDVTDLAQETETLNAYIEEVDEDLGTLEEVVYEEFDDCDCDCDCDCCHDDFDDCDCLECDEGEEDEEYDFFKVVCPSCNEEVYLDNTIDPSKIICPSCHNGFSAVENN